MAARGPVGSAGVSVTHAWRMVQALLNVKNGHDREELLLVSLYASSIFSHSPTSPRTAKKKYDNRYYTKNTDDQLGVVRQQPAPRRVEPRAVRAGEEVLEPRRVDVGVLFESEGVRRRVRAVPED